MDQGQSSSPWLCGAGCQRGGAGDGGLRNQRHVERNLGRWIQARGTSSKQNTLTMQAVLGKATRRLDSLSGASQVHGACENAGPGIPKPVADFVSISVLTCRPKKKLAP